MNAQTNANLSTNAKIDIDTDEAVLWEAFVAAGEPRRYFAGAALFLEGDPPGTVFAIVAGEVRVTSDPEGDGEEVTLSTSGPGQLLGEVSAIDGLPRSASAFAITDVDAIALPSGRFNQLLEEQPALAMRVMRLLANRLRKSTDDRVQHRHGDAMTRIATSLVALAEDRGHHVGTAVRIETTQQELAFALDNDREMTSRALAGLAGEGWIELHADGVDVLNLPALRRLAADADHPAF
jgi:CRP/FNR family cyclic AMP-dependent transcriptional regulator